LSDQTNIIVGHCCSYWDNFCTVMELSMKIENFHHTTIYNSLTHCVYPFEFVPLTIY